MLDSKIAMKRALGFKLTEEEQKRLEVASYQDILDANRAVIENAGDGDQLETTVDELIKEEYRARSSNKTDDEKLQFYNQLDLLRNRFLVNMFRGISSEKDLLGPSLRETCRKSL